MVEGESRMHGADGVCAGLLRAREATMTMHLTRRGFVKLSAMVGAGAALPGWAKRAWGEALAVGLSDPALQPKFAYVVPNALDPGFMHEPDRNGRYRVGVGEGSQRTGLVDGRGRLLKTSIFGYKGGPGANTVTWPGRSFQVQRNSGETHIRWQNELGKRHLLPVDTSLHWAYSLQGYQQYSIEQNGVPIVTHVHGGHSDFQFDGNPEFFYNPGATITGPQWQNVPGGFTEDFRYDNDVPAASLWYHDHALGITRAIRSGPTSSPMRASKTTKFPSLRRSLSSSATTWSSTA
jgi:FtsP/CotA-like multicopper oxidase with cupredoxin domain